MTTASSKETRQLARRDLQQQVTNTIISQLEKGIIPWHHPWKGGNSATILPENFVTGNNYRGINILLLWCSAIDNEYISTEWASFKQWNSKNEAVRKGEKGTMIVYYDTIEKEVHGEIEKIPFLKSSYVFNRCQLQSYNPDEHKPEINLTPLVDRIEAIDYFVANTKAIIEHKGNRACYIRSLDKIEMPLLEAFRNTPTRTATEGYYSVLLHELTHWSGAEKRLNRTKGKNFGDADYAAEELTAELGAAFLCAEFGISSEDKADHVAYISQWLEVLKNNKQCIFTASRFAKNAVEFMHSLQPT